MGDGGRGSTVLGMPTVRIPRSCKASRRAVSLSARSPASEWMAGVGRVPTWAMACSTLVTKGSTYTGITGIAHGQMPGKDKARRRLGDNPGLAAELGGAMAFAFANGRNRGIVRVDNFAVAQRLALRQSAGLGCDPLMRLERGRELGVQTRPLRPPTGPSRRGGSPGWPAPASGPAVPSPAIGVSVWRTSVTNTFPIPRHWRPKRRITFRRSCWSCWTCPWSAVSLEEHCAVMDVMTSRTFFWPYTGSWHH